jgi:hypothetical protein
LGRCQGVKRDGSRCTLPAAAGDSYCWAHSPSHADERKRYASKGGKAAGRGRPLVELGEAKALLRTLADSVLDGTVDRSDAAVVSQVLGTFLRAVSTEVKVKEHTEFEERLDRLEQAASEGSSAWRR